MKKLSWILDYIVAVAVVILSSIFGEIFYGKKMLFFGGAMAVVMDLVAFFYVKIFLNVRRGGTDYSIPHFKLAKYSLIGMLILFLYNSIGIQNFDQDVWAEINGQIFFLLLVGGLLVYFVSCVLISIYGIKHMVKHVSNTIHENDRDGIPRIYTYISLLILFLILAIYVYIRIIFHE